jgi:hypothetical protein
VPDEEGRLDVRGKIKMGEFLRHGFLSYGPVRQCRSI